MNKIFKSKFNLRRNTHVAVSESTKGQSKNQSTRKKNRIYLLISTLMATSAPAAWASPVTISNSWIQAGVSDYGTLGSNSSTPPGILYDSTGTQTFDPTTDYLTPGTPWQMFAVASTETGLQINNNDGTQSIATVSGPTDTSTASASSASWTGQYQDYYHITNNYSIDKTIKGIAVETTITADQDLNEVKFLTALDPDPDALNHGVYDTNNGRGSDKFTENDWVFSEGAVTGLPIGIYSSSSYLHNTGVSGSWSSDPDFYLSGQMDGNGDYTIGMAFYIGQLLAGSSAVLDYKYLVGDNQDDIDPQNKTNIDLQKPYYLGTNLGTSVNPAFEGGTLKLDQSGFYASDFTINSLGGILDADGNESRFKGIFSDLSGTQGGDLTITDSTGTNGKVTFEAMNTYTGKTNIKDTTLMLANSGDISSSKEVALTGHQSVFDISNVATGETSVQDLSGVSGSKINMGDTVLTAGTSNRTEFSGTFNGNGGFTKIGSGTILLTGDSNEYNGINTVAAGELSVNGILGGQSMTIQNNATLSGNGSIGGQVTSQTGGIISPDGPTMGTLTLLGDYTGQVGSKLILQSTLNGDNSATDVLHINGDTNGTTTVEVENINGHGATTSNGIQVINVQGMSNTNFLLNQAFIPVNSYEYRLVKNGINNNDGNWYLRSTYRPGIANYVSTLSANIESGALLISDIHQRIGNPYIPDANQKRTWGRLIGNHIKKFGHDQFDYHQTSKGFQVGGDIWTINSKDNTQHQVGITGQYINGSLDTFDTKRSTVGLSTKTGEIDSDIYGLGAYYTLLHKNNAYVDIVGQINRVENKLSDVYGYKNHLNGWQYALSLEIGKSFPITKTLSIEPQAQLTYIHTNYQSTQDNLSKINADNVHSLTARIGAQINKQFTIKSHDMTSYLLANLKHEFANENTIKLDSLANDHSDQISEKYGKNSYEFGIGVQSKLTNQAYIYGDIRHQRGFGNGHQSQLNLGFKVSF